MAIDPFDDPFAEGDYRSNRSSRDSHTARLSAVVTAPKRPTYSIQLWLTRIIIAFGALSALIWYAIPTPQARQYPERKAVRIWHQWTGERQLVVDGIVKLFNDSQSHYEAMALAIPANVMDQKFMLSVAGKDPPDVVTQWGPTVSTWAADGLIQPLDALLSDNDWRILREDTYPIVLTAGSHQGKFYGLTIGLNTYGLYFQTQRLREIGYTASTLPNTLEELMELSHKLDRVSANGDLERIGFLPSRLALFAALFGGGFRVTESGDITIVSEGNVRALEFITESYRRYGFNRVVNFRSSLNHGGLASEWPFVSGQYPIALDGQWRVEQLATYAPEIKYQTAMVPTPRGGVPGAGFATANLAFIPIGARETQGAIAFMRFWSGLERPERAASFLTKGGWLPMRRAITESPRYRDFIAANPQIKNFLHQLDNFNLIPIPAVPIQVFFNNKLIVCEDHAVRGTKTPRQALEDFDAEVRQERARRERIEAMRGQP